VEGVMLLARFAFGFLCIQIIKYAMDDATDMHATRTRYVIACIEVALATVLLVGVVFVKDEYLFALMR